MRCLVTGHRGFLGSHTTEQLRAADVEVLDLEAHRLPWEGLRQWMDSEQPDAIVHLAGPTSVAGSLTDPLQDFAGSVGVTAQLLHSLGKLQPVFVYVSSAAVYGEPLELPVAESAQRMPLSAYGMHRHVTEELVLGFGKQRNFRTHILRVFSAYGARLHRQVVHDLCSKAALNRPLELDGTGEETRDFVHGSDVAAAIAMTLQSPDAPRVMNVGSGHETTIREVGELIASAANLESPVFSGKVRTGDPRRWQAATGLLRSIGWSPRVKLQDGIAEVLAARQASLENARVAGVGAVACV